MTDVLIYADTMRSPELRHEVALGVPDPFLYLEKDGAKHIMIGSMEIPRLREVGGFELHPAEEFGMDELIATGMDYNEIRDELILRAVRGIGIESAVVPVSFPLAVADMLRANGIELSPDRDFFAGRRGVKTAAEVEGIRRAQKAGRSIRPVRTCSSTSSDVMR